MVVARWIVRVGLVGVITLLLATLVFWWFQTRPERWRRNVIVSFVPGTGREQRRIRHLGAMSDTVSLVSFRICNKNVGETVSWTDFTPVTFDRGHSSRSSIYPFRNLDDLAPMTASTDLIVSPRSCATFTMEGTFVLRDSVAVTAVTTHFSGEASADGSHW